MTFDTCQRLARVIWMLQPGGGAIQLDDLTNDLAIILATEMDSNGYGDQLKSKIKHTLETGEMGE